MISERFKIVCLFGFSPHFPEITSFLDRIKTRCFIVYSPRQKNAMRP